MKRISILLIALSIASLSFAQGAGDLENQFYIRFGLSQPANSYFGIEDKSDWDDIKRIGGVVELGSIFMFNFLPLADGLRLGLNVDYAEISYHRFNYHEGDDIVGFYKLTSNIGPSISYSPVSDLVFDIYIKIKGSWAALVTSSFDDDMYYGYFGTGFTTGFNVRYNVLMVGFEFNTDKMKLVNTDNEDHYIGNAKDDSDYTPMPCFNLTLGFSF